MAFSLFADVEVDSILELTPDWCGGCGIRLLLLDFDNTILPYSAADPTEEFMKWLETARAAGITVMVVSNSRRSRRVPDFCEKAGLPYIKRAGKPFPKGIRRAMAQQGFSPRETAMVGDQTFTDVLGGNLSGVTSVLVRPIHLSDPFLTVRYWIELPVIHFGRKRRKR